MRLLAARAPQLTLSLAAALAALLTLAAPAGAEPALPEGFQDTVAIDGLEQPTSFRFAADGRVFVAEKPGRIIVFDDLDDPTPELFADLRTEVYDSGDRGLLGLALDPEFTNGRPYVYALYTYDHVLGDAAPAPKWGKAKTTGDPCPDLNGGDACLVSGRLVRLTAEGNQAKEVGGVPDQEELAEGWCQQFSSHSVGDLEFGPEGALYASGGDGASFGSADWGQFGTTPNPCGDPPGGYGTALSPPTAEGGSLRSQSLHLLNGKIIRVDPDTGEGLPTNPMGSSPDENTRRIIASGFRNPFRFSIDPQTGEIYTGNVGSSEIEEIDRFAAPPPTIFNSGWPCYEGPERQYQFRAEELSVCEALYEDEPETASQPFFYYSHGQAVVPDDECPLESGSALGGISFYEGGKFPPAYEGALFFADSVRGCIWAMFPGADGRPDPATATRFLREGKVYPGVDIQEGPDGYLYYVDLFGDEENGPGAIHRISYSPGAPTARLTADPPYGAALPLQVDFDAGGSTDPDGDPLEYDWDLDGNGSFEAHGGTTRSLQFTAAEQQERKDNEEELNREVAVRVSDSSLSSVARVTVYPGDSPPQAIIDAPLASSTWGVNQNIHFDGTALDFEGHHLPSLSFYWSTRLFHCPTGPTDCHGHPLQIFPGLTEGDFLAPEHDFPSYIEITLRVADYRGLTASKTLRIDPRTVDLAISSSPPGIQLTAGLLQGPSPLSLTAIEGSNVLLSAPATAQIGGRTYGWESWSDGGARSHSVHTGSDASYRAIYSAVAGPDGTDGRGESPAGPRRGTPAAKARLIAHPAKESARKTARFAFVADQARASFRCKLDRGKLKPCASPRVYRRLKPGRHLFTLVATGADGKAGPSLTFGWKVLAPKSRR